MNKEEVIPEGWWPCEKCGRAMFSSDPNNKTCWMCTPQECLRSPTGKHAFIGSDGGKGYRKRDGRPKQHSRCFWCGTKGSDYNARKERK